jgi:carbonic anhydrase
MSNQNINISNQNVQGKCDLKCSYSYNYPESSNLTAQNQGVSIVLTPDNTTSPAVTYNNQKYNVTNFSIVCPSLHNYNGSQAAAEVLITHAPVNGGQNLSVAIPIISSSDSSTASYLITEIIQSVANNAPSQGKSTNLNLSRFTLKDVVPKKPFYSYTDTASNAEWIVFGTLYAIPLNTSTLNTLRQIIKPYPLPMRGGPLFFNSSGPNSGLSIGDGIYIKCNPTGSSTEETAVEYSKNTPSYDLMNLLESPVTMLIVQIIIGIILFIIVFAIISYIFSFITTGSTKLPTSFIPGQTGGKVY